MADFVIILIFILVVLPIMAYYHASNKKRKNEKISEAVDKYLSDVSDSFSDITYSLTASSEQKMMDRAKRDLESFKTSIFISSYDKKMTAEEIVLDRLEHPYDGDVKKAIEVLNLNEAYVIKTCITLFYCGIILSWDKEHRNSTYMNEHWYDMKEGLRVALKELSIPKDEWISYGSKVLHMHDLVEKRYYDFYIRD